MKHILPTLAILFLACHPLVAQDTEADTLANSEKTIDEMMLDLSVPDLTAANLLDISREEVIEPGNVRELVVSVLPYLQDQTNTFAIEWAPFNSTAKDRRYNKYKNGYLLKGLQLSYARSVDTAANRQAIGIKWTYNKGDVLKKKHLNSLVDKLLKEATVSTPSADDNSRRLTKLLRELYSDKDPQDIADIITDLGIGTTDTSDGLTKADTTASDYVEAIIGALQRKGLVGSSGCLAPEQMTAIVQIAEDEAYLNRILATTTDKVAADIEKYREELESYAWNAFAVDLGFGLSSTDPAAASARRDKWSAFAGLKFPFLSKKSGQGILHLQYDKVNPDPKPLGEASLLDSLSSKIFIGFEWQHKLGSQDRRFTAQLSQSFKDFATPAADFGINTTRLTAGLNVKITDNLWLQAAGGYEWNNDSRLGNGPVASTEIAYALTRKKKE